MNLICAWAPVLFFLFSMIEISYGGKRDTGRKIILIKEPTKRKTSGLDGLDYICEPHMDLETTRNRLTLTRRMR